MSARRISAGSAKMSATPDQMAGCVRMDTIHSPRAIIHRQSPMRRAGFHPVGQVSQPASVAQANFSSPQRATGFIPVESASAPVRYRRAQPAWIVAALAYHARESNTRAQARFTPGRFVECLKETHRPDPTSIKLASSWWLAGDDQPPRHSTDERRRWQRRPRRSTSIAPPPSLTRRATTSLARIPHSAFRIPHSEFRIPHSALVKSPRPAPSSPTYPAPPAASESPSRSPPPFPERRARRRGRRWESREAAEPASALPANRP
jgi:hypothetical protein